MSSNRITFDTIPSSIRKPGSYAEINTRLAAAGLPINAQRLLFIGQRLSTGSVAELTTRQVYDAGDAADAFGYGSVLHLMAKTAFKANKYLQLFCIAVNDADGGVARVGTMTIAGTIAAAGWVRLYVGNEYVQVSYLSTATAITIATALVAELDKLTGLPYTYTRSDGVITFTAKNKGTVGNMAPVSAVVSTLGGATATWLQTTAGSTDPDLHASSGVLDTIAGARFNVICACLNDSTSLGYLKTHINSVSSAREKKAGVIITACVDSLANAATLADVDSGRIALGQLKASQTPVYQIAANIAAVKAAQEDPAVSLSGTPLIDVLPPADADISTVAEQETLLLNGVMPLAPGDSGYVEIVRLRSTAQTDAALYDLKTICIMDYVRDVVTAMYRRKGYNSGKLTDRRMNDLRSDIIASLVDLEDVEILENVVPNKDGVIVERDAQDSERVNVRIPADIVNSMEVIASRIDLIL
jgi:phage tail sheath gpL-like